MKAFLKNYRQSPRKVRLVAGLIKGKRVAEAFVHLNALPKRASLPIQKLLSSAIANAKNAGISDDNLYIENITVNKGIVLKRSRARARGSAFRINKRTSHVTLNLAEKGLSNKKEISTTKKPKVEKTDKEIEKKITKKIVKKEVKSKTIAKDKKVVDKK